MTDTIWAVIGHAKDISTIVMPILITIVGLAINKTIQQQNRIAERHSAFIKQWADKFLELSGNADDLFTDIAVLYWKNTNIETFAPNSIDSEFELFNAKIREFALLLDRYGMSLKKFAAFAPNKGRDFIAGFDAMGGIARSWFSNSGGDIQEFIKSQVTFNKCARDMHFELLHLDG